MSQPPRVLTDTFLRWREISMSVIQGLVIVCGTMFIYRYAVSMGCGENLTRTMVFITLIVANIFLTFVNRSFYYSVLTSLKYKNNLMWVALLGTVVLLACLLFIPFARDFFRFSSPTFTQLGIASAVGFVSVIWFEGYKLVKRMRQ